MSGGCFDTVHAGLWVEFVPLSPPSMVSDGLVSPLGRGGFFCP